MRARNRRSIGRTNVRYELLRLAQLTPLSGLNHSQRGWATSPLRGARRTIYRLPDEKSLAEAQAG